MKQIKWMGTYVVKLCKVRFNLLPTNLITVCLQCAKFFPSPPECTSKKENQVIKPFFDGRIISI